MSVREISIQPAPRIILTSSKAVEIYMHKLSILQDHGARNCPESLYVCLRGRSGFVSSDFNVSPKTIRDIWTRRTWQRATCHLWEDEDSLLTTNPEAISKAEFRGRPRGARDTRPRKRPTQRAAEQGPAWPLPPAAAPDRAATNAPGTAAGPDAPSPTHSWQHPAPDSDGPDPDSEGSQTCRQPHADGGGPPGSAIDFLWSTACFQAAAAAAAAA
eukprot:CAMPEP_0172183482 /NCGR_PEP_ID=MMETSP1050-20130122/19018_1 /TAXON_ID=233186 /ORGANISM="Cryptomonas curvata, Strain CCAP979/52" /LENGTH=214 /DNA_ID=CAMNT_0012857121 /DNA_START=126 /DNA_END=767 /DNA_ORIENTATION=+